jgi:WD40 repeat protein
LRVEWISDGLIVTASNENLVRVWDISRDVNFALQLPSGNDVQLGTTSHCNFTDDHKISDISYNASKQTLAVASKEKKIFFWKYNPQFEGPHAWKVS